MRAKVLTLIGVGVLVALPAVAGEWFVPAAAHADGAEGSVWRTNLVIRNHGVTDAEVTVALLKQNRDNTEPAAEATMVVPAGAVRSEPDAVAGLFGAQGAAALRVTSDHDELMVTTRTFNQSAEGTYGQSIPGVAADATVAPNVPAVLLGLSGTEGRRSNVGWVNATETPITVTFELYTSSGALLASDSFDEPPYGQRQLNDVFATLGVNPVGAAYARVMADGSFQPYASVVAALSNDPIYVPALTGAATATDLVIPAAAKVGGAQNTDWRTDAWMLNLGTSEARATFSLWRHGQANPDPETAAITAAPGEMVTLVDAMGELFGAEGVQGALSIQADQLVVASSRTYNTTAAKDTAAATYGQFIPAVPVATLARSGETVAVLGARADSSFRSNLGVVATGDESEVDLVLRSAEGTELATRRISLRENQPFQASLESGALFGIEGYTDATVEATLASAAGDDAAIAVYLSTVDNLSSDPTFALASRVEGQPLEVDEVNELLFTATYVLGSSVEATQPSSAGKTATTCVSVDRTGDTLRRGENPVGKCWQGSADFAGCEWDFPNFSFFIEGLAATDICILDGYRSSFQLDLATEIHNEVDGTVRDFDAVGDLGVAFTFSETWIEDVTLDGEIRFSNSFNWIEAWADLTWTANLTGYEFIPVGVLQATFPYDGTTVHATAYFDGTEWVTVEVQYGNWKATYRVNIITGQVTWS